jgi:hypothetical protein
MNDPAATPRLDFARLMRAAEGLTQWRSIVLGFSTLLVAGLLATAGGYLSQSLGGTGGALIALFLGILALVLVASGYSGAGVMLMDRAKGLAPRSMMDALVFGLMCLPKFIAFALVLGILFVGLALAGALVYLVCKIPGVGPLLLFIAHPVMVLTAALVFTVVTWVAFPLFAPAVWDGRSFRESLSIVFAVARTRLLQVVVLLLALYVLASVILGLLASAMVPGYMFMTGLAAGILGGGGSVSMALFGSMSGGISGHAYALGMASALMVVAAMTLMFQVVIMGVNLVYLSATEGLDTSHIEAQIEKRLQQAKEKAREGQERARAASDRARAMPQHATVGASAMQVASAAPACPACGTPINADDFFCGNCGHKLK